MASVFRSVLSDATILWVFQVALGLLLVVSAFQTLLARRRGGADVVVKRGDQSLNFLYAVYGVTTVVYSLLVQVAEAAQGYKAALLAADYIVLTYVCLFNSWFRNKLIGVYPRIQQD